MAELATIPILLAVLASYLLVLWVFRARRAIGLADFLFSGNTVGLSISSGVGSLLSVSVACTALLSAGYLYGWQILFSSVAGTAAGTAVLLRLLRSSSVRAFKERQDSSGLSMGASYIAFLASRGRTRYSAGAALMLVLVYAAMLASELAVVRVTMGVLVPLEPAETLLVLAVLVGICFSYVLIGGYRAVLVTDHFQVAVVAGFFGMLCGAIDWTNIHWSALSTPSKSALAFPTVGHHLALHGASFVGSACLIVGSVDHWIRTVGTLSLRQSRSAVVASSLLGTVLGSVLVLAGTYVARISAAPVGVAGQGSLELLTAVVNMGSPSLTFMFFAALACVALTTLDTYMIAQQQLYYEFVSQFKTRSAKTYLIEYILSWRQVRLIGFLLVAAAFAVSVCVASDRIYVVGVAALSAPIAFSPLLVIASTRLAERAALSQLLERPTSPIVLSFVLWLPAMRALESEFGSATNRLYLLPLGLACAAGVAYAGCLVWLLVRQLPGVAKR